MYIIEMYVLEMNNSFLNEILFRTFNKLNMVDVLYSLADVSQRLDQLVFDLGYIRNLAMASIKMKSSFDLIFSINNQVLDRICKNILPRIHHQVNELIVEQNSMERVLYAIHYIQLYWLSLVDFQIGVLIKYLAG